MKQIIITKASEEKVYFSSDKLGKSFLRSVANDETINEIIGEVESQIFDRIITKKIYQIAFGILKKSTLVLIK